MRLGLGFTVRVRAEKDKLKSGGVDIHVRVLWVMIPSLLVVVCFTLSVLDCETHLGQEFHFIIYVQHQERQQILLQLTEKEKQLTEKEKQLTSVQEQLQKREVEVQGIK